MKRIGVCAGICMLAAGWAAPALATNGYQLIGVGQLQKGMAGAVTAAPMDTMTAITNPAGMARVGDRADFSMEAFMPVRQVSFNALGGGSDEGGSELYGIPSVGWVASAFDRDDMVFGGGMFATSGLGVDYDQTVLAPAAAFGTSGDITFSGYSAIQFWKMAPTVAWRQSDQLSLGASLNVDYQSLTISQTFQHVPFIPPPNERTINFDLGRPTNQMGFGATFGVLYDVTPMVTLGATYATKQVFGDAVYRLGDNDLLNYNGAVGAPGRYKLGLDYPQQAAVGVAVRPTGRVLVDFDVKWINWSDTHDQVTLKGPANSFDTNGDNVGDTGSTTLAFGWDDQVVYALGVQVAATDAVTVRGGFNYAKAPINARDVFNNLVFPAVVEKHFTLGADWRMGRHWGIGGTYMIALKEKVTGSGDISPAFQGATGFPPSSGARIALRETSVGLLLYYLMGG